MNRRRFLSATAAAALGWHDIEVAGAASVAWPGARPSAYDKVLVLIELKGGNDGLNTLVPYRDDAYYALRPRLAITADRVVRLTDDAGLHPALAPLSPLWQKGEMAVLQGVGYPDPNLSHFRSIEIWDTASDSKTIAQEGWLARAFRALPPPTGFAADGVVIGSNDLGPLTGNHVRAVALSDPEQFLRSAKLARPEGRARNAALAHILEVEADVVQAAAHLEIDHAFATSFPVNPFGKAIRTAAQLIANPSSVAVVRVTLNGFDTHSAQPGTQARLLGDLADGIAALRAALLEIDRWDRTLVLTYAEFGRRPKENLSEGTDHGTASVHFAWGGAVKGGMYGEAPRLDALDPDGNVRHGLDFRAVYATVLSDWWRIPGSRTFVTAKPVPFLRV